MTKKRWVAWLACLWPFLTFADGASFTPPTGDYSVIFLSNIFGVVDGVLNGTGSQVVGTMFSVLNAAVLAIGGIVIMYTLVVATMNTAHEGKFLGEKWSSIWVPVRISIGLALLLPKASGYCMMQIFFMWVVVQGVGAADKVWNAALQYLNRGGVIIAEQLKTSSTSSSSTANITQGAMTILAGQVCMLGLQNVLQAAQKSYQSTANSSGPCYGTAPNSSVTAICTAAVPDFLGSVNAVAAQQLQTPSGYESSLCQSSSSSSSSTSTASLPAYFIVQMPNFPSTSEYVSLNGICGSIAWNPISSTWIQSVQNTMSSASCSDLQATAFSRAIAIQQMYVDLQSIATTMVNNDPQLAALNSTSSSTSTTTTTFSSIATNQFGVPLQSNNQLCTPPLPNNNCVSWGADQTTNVAVPVLFSGTELNQAVLDYDAVMMPTLNLVAAANSAANDSSSRKFISDAQQQGWLMAGAYFFNLITLNGNASTSSQEIDSTSGLEQSVTPCSSFQSSSFGASNACNPTQACGSAATPDAAATTYSSLCYMLNMNPTNANYVNALISGLGLSMTPLSISSTTFSNSNQTPITGIGSSTVYGFGINESMVTLPGQPGTTPPTFQFNFKASIDPSSMSLPKMHFAAGPFGLGYLIGNILYNFIIKNLLQFVVNLIMQIVGLIVTLLLVLPMMASANIILAAMKILTQNGVNPIVCLGNMGTSLVNYVMDFIPVGITAALFSAFMPMTTTVLVAMAPFTVSMVLAFFSVGMITAYYIPLVPYIAFLTGVIAWFIAVIEAMVAAPLVALGVVYPEGHEVLGKSEPGFMILLNVFLRPCMMIIGFILGISLSYVSIWVLNAGFQNAQAFFEGSQGIQYISFAGMLTIFYSTMIYTMLYLTLVQKAFSLIYILPDGILRWIGGQSESIGGQAAQWGQESKDQVAQMGKKLQSGVTDTKAASAAGREVHHGDRQDAMARDAASNEKARQAMADERKKLSSAAAKKAAPPKEPPKDEKDGKNQDGQGDNNSADGEGAAPSIQRGAIGGVPESSSTGSSTETVEQTNEKVAKEDEAKQVSAGQAIEAKKTQEQLSKIKSKANKAAEGQSSATSGDKKEASGTTTSSSSSSTTTSSSTIVDAGQTSAGGEVADSEESSGDTPAAAAPVAGQAESVEQTEAAQGAKAESPPAEKVDSPTQNATPDKDSSKNESGTQGQTTPKKPKKSKKGSSGAPSAPPASPAPVKSSKMSSSDIGRMLLALPTLGLSEVAIFAASLAYAGYKAVTSSSDNTPEAVSDSPSVDSSQPGSSEASSGTASSGKAGSAATAPVASSTTNKPAASPGKTSAQSTTTEATSSGVTTPASNQSGEVRKQRLQAHRGKPKRMRAHIWREAKLNKDDNK